MCTAEVSISYDVMEGKGSGGGVFITVDIFVEWYEGVKCGLLLFQRVSPSTYRMTADNMENSLLEKLPISCDSGSEYADPDCAPSVALISLDVCPANRHDILSY